MKCYQIKQLIASTSAYIDQLSLIFNIVFFRSIQLLFKGLSLGCTLLFILIVFGVMLYWNNLYAKTILKIFIIKYEAVR